MELYIILPKIDHVNQFLIISNNIDVLERYIQDDFNADVIIESDRNIALISYTVKCELENTFYNLYMNKNYFLLLLTHRCFDIANTNSNKHEKQLFKINASFLLL